MPKFVQFPAERDESLFVYPDDISLFGETVVIDGVVHAEYFGDLELEQSALYMQRMRDQAMLSTKQRAFELISDAEGEGRWRQVRADDYARLGDSSYIDELVAERNRIREASNTVEQAISEMTMDELQAFNADSALSDALDGHSR